MMIYKIVLSKNFEKKYRKLPTFIQERVKKILLSLEKSLLGDPLKGDLSGFYSIHFEGNKYRLIYFLKDNRIEIVAVHVGKRTECFYDDFRRKL